MRPADGLPKNTTEENTTQGYLLKGQKILWHKTQYYPNSVDLGPTMMFGE